MGVVALLPLNIPPFKSLPTYCLPLVSLRLLATWWRLISTGLKAVALNPILDLAFQATKGPNITYL